MGTSYMTEQSIMFSVIIPHYRDFAGLKELIRSIPDRNDIQIIIVDDNSYPDTQDVYDYIGSFNRPDIQLLYNDKNKRGAGSCRNIGISKAKGKWLIFADSDDFFTDNAFEAFDSKKDSTDDYIHFHMTSINLPDRTPGTRQLQDEYHLNRFCRRPTYYNELNLRYNIDSPCAKMVNHRFVSDNGIVYGETRWGNDTMFAVQCGYYAKHVGTSKETVYCATRKKDSMTTHNSIEIRKTFVDVYIQKIEFMRNRLSYKDFRRSIRWPGYKILNGCLDGYGKEFSDYVRREYRNNDISLWWINRYDFEELIIRVITYFKDRKYTKT